MKIGVRIEPAPTDAQLREEIAKQVEGWRRAYNNATRQSEIAGLEERAALLLARRGDWIIKALREK